MTRKTFEEYLAEKFLEENPWIIKDKFEANFEVWLSELEGGDYIKYADEYGELREMWATHTL